MLDERWFLIAYKEIVFLLNLPNYLKAKHEDLKNLYEEIKVPVMAMDDTGYLNSNCPPTHSQASYLLLRQDSINGAIKRAKKRAKRIVNAIKQLDEHKQHTLFSVFADDPIENKSYRDICVELSEYLKRDRDSNIIEFKRQNKEKIKKKLKTYRL